MTRTTRRALPALVAMLAASACGGDSGGSTGPGVEGPMPTAVVPAEGTAGTEVRIEGTRFADEGVTVFFGELESPRVAQQDGDLIVTAPAGLEGGVTYDVRVANPDLESGTLTQAFTAVAPSPLSFNRATRATGLVGMTVVIEGSAFGDDLALAEGAVYFSNAVGEAVPAPIAVPAADWSDSRIVTAVPNGAVDGSWMWVETATGVSDSILLRVSGSAAFSPPALNWTATAPLPQGLSGLGAVLVRSEDAASRAHYVFTVGGSSASEAATTVVYRARVEQSGALDEGWTTAMPLPAARAHAATAAATAATAAVDTTTTSGFVYVLGGLDEAGAVTGTAYVGHVDATGGITGWQTTTDLPAPTHSAAATVVGGYLYLAGGADAENVATSSTYRAALNEDGTLGEWQEMDALPTPAAYHALVAYGPYLYAIGGEAGSAAPERFTASGTERAEVDLLRLDPLTGGFLGNGWVVTQSLTLPRAKHSGVFAGRFLFVTSGVYPGDPGSSETVFSQTYTTGSAAPWQEATFGDVIANDLGISLYNQAAVSFTDDAGTAHVLVLGGASRADGTPSAGVVYY